jgi:hypothetical protein
VTQEENAASQGGIYRTVQVGGLDVAHVVLQVAVQRQQVGRDVLVRHDLQHLAHLDGRPLDVLGAACAASDQGLPKGLCAAVC